MSYLPGRLDSFPPVGDRPVPAALSVVVPCHNEESALPHLFRRLEQLSADLTNRGLICGPLSLVLVDDGSRDATWQLIKRADTTLPVQGVRLTRNFGHQAALMAGIAHASGDVVVTMDADLQDDPDAVIGMLEAYGRGAEIVFGVRASRASDTVFKRVTARTYYRLLCALGADIVPNHADFRLMSRRALDALDTFNEANLFLRGIVPRLGFRTECVLYDRAPRVNGISSYPIGRMIALALDGVTSLSAQPIRLITLTGFAVALLTLAFVAFSLIAWTGGRTVPGWTSIVLPLSLLGGMQLIALGVIGEYVGKIYEETKRRPRFLVEAHSLSAGAQKRIRTVEKAQT